MILLIVESPANAKIESFLGKGYKVIDMWAYFKIDNLIK